MGKKKRPFYRIVAADSRRARDGRFLEVLGTYNPIEQPAVISVKEERISYWLNNGAEPSDTVGTLLTQIGFTQKYHKAQAGVDVTEMALKATITERKKKTRKAKKVIAARAQAVEAEAAAKVADAAAKAAEAAAGEHKTEG
jgi:small subunit ribosomal protein S16